VIAGWGLPSGFGVAGLLEQSRPAGTATTVSTDVILGAISLPAEHDSHAEDIHVTATLTAFATAAAGVLLAALMYLRPLVSPAVVARLAGPAYTFLVNRWYVDELYHILFVMPTLRLARLISGIDRTLIDGLINGIAWAARQIAGIDAWFDRTVVDSLVTPPGGSPGTLELNAAAADRTAAAVRDVHRRQHVAISCSRPLYQTRWSLILADSSLAPLHAWITHDAQS
jgi:NADH:ubiquinone oxidoreductase subunit 5 (chain L)/Multisubunit Na+/H+ antiporter, MnhA subunit